MTAPVLEHCAVCLPLSWRAISVWSSESPCLCLSCPELVLCPLEGKLLAVKSGDKNNQHLWWIFIYQCRTALIFSVLVFLTQIGPAQTSYYDRRHSEAHHLKIVFPVNNCIKQQLVHRQHTGGMWSPPSWRLIQGWSYILYKNGNGNENQNAFYSTPIPSM